MSHEGYQFTDSTNFACFNEADGNNTDDGDEAWIKQLLAETYGDACT